MADQDTTDNMYGDYEFVIRGTATAIERMGAVTRNRLYCADEHGALSGDVRLAEGVTVRRTRGKRAKAVKTTMNADELAEVAVASLDIDVRMGLRYLMMEAMEK